MNKEFKCFRCGYCCIMYDVVIIDDPEIGLVADENDFERNLKIKSNDVMCQHLRGDKIGETSCAVHDKEWYPDTPCAKHGSENFGDGKCNIGRAAMGVKPFAHSGEKLKQMLEEKLCQKMKKREATKTRT